MVALDIEGYLGQAARVLEETGRACAVDIGVAAAAIADSLQRGGKVLLCGNGGGAASAQHFAAEMVGFLNHGSRRPGLGAIALTTDTSFLTAFGNDCGFDQVFARQVQALGRRGDVLVAISTSGNSENLCRAASAAQALGLLTVGLLGGDGGRLRERVDRAVVVPCADTQHIQEAHAAIVHVLCAWIETTVAESLPS